MIAEKPSLLTRYETLRRKEFERLTSLLDTLGRVDGLPADQMDQARDALFHADHPYLIVLVGAFNTGKSSIINALIGQPVLGVGATPTTSKVAILRHGPSQQNSQAGDVETIFYPAPLLEKVSLVDTPGLDSVFKGHDEVTRRFLHRADIVLLIMMATQAMSATNVEYLQSLKAYGKRVIVAVNQIDLLEPEEKTTLTNFVADQSKLTLGFVPDVWMISSKLAAEAQKASPRDEALWAQSGFAQVESFISDALSDAARVRQKLQTPLQIVRNVTTIAAGHVRQQQDALSDYRRAADNVQGQMDAATREQRSTLHQTTEEIDQQFAEGARRGREAIADVFQFSRAAGLALTGVADLIGVVRILQRFGTQTPAKAAFETRKVDEPFGQIPAILDRLGPRLEGRDVKDVDDLILYTRKEVERLPGNFQNKLVGKLDTPTTYDRTIMRDARDGLITILDKARAVEFQRIDRAVRNSLIFLGAYEVLLIVAAIIAALSLIGQQGGGWAILLVVVILLGLLGLAFVPLRGSLMANAYAGRIRAVNAEFDKALETPAGRQIAFGVQMRQDAVAPFMRLVEAQTSQVEKLKTELAAHEQGLVTLEKELGEIKG